MNITIDTNGLLYLQRGKEMKSQFCPFSSDTLQQCGDWCPMFHTYKQHVELYCGRGVSLEAKNGETFKYKRK